MPEALQVVLTFAGMAALCAALERVWPFQPDAPRWRPDAGTDVWYNAIRVVLSAGLALATGAAGASLPGRGPSPVGSLGLPLWAEVLAFLFLADLIQYWSHWVMHVWKPLWHVHAVHHSPEAIDWLVAARVHPFELAVNKAVSAVPLYLLGFSPAAIAVAVPLAASYSLLIHSNLRWTYGPLGYLIVSPAFHHWHHASDEPARDKNFAQTFAVIDFLFGTAYFPRGKAPSGYGLVSGAMPRGLIPQFFHPVRQWLWPDPTPAADAPPAAGPAVAGARTP